MHDCGVSYLKTKLAGQYKNLVESTPADSSRARRPAREAPEARFYKNPGCDLAPFCETLRIAWTRSALRGPCYALLLFFSSTSIFARSFPTFLIAAKT